MEHFLTREFFPTSRSPQGRSEVSTCSGRWSLSPSREEIEPRATPQRHVACLARTHGTEARNTSLLYDAVKQSAEYPA